MGTLKIAPGCTMVAQPLSSPVADIIYPDSDGKPMADNTKQFRWSVTIKENLEILFADEPDVFVAGDLLWYPVEGNNKLRQAPDVMVVFGRPKGDRGSYQQWKEDKLPPQVVFEILSPGNRAQEMTRKALFYQRHGVEEYYLYDPDDNELSGWLWSGLSPATSVASLLPPNGNGSRNVSSEIADLRGWISPRLGIRFEPEVTGLKIFTPQGTPFLTSVELAQQRDEAQQQRNEAQQQRDEARQRAEKLAEKLRELGIDPETL